MKLSKMQITIVDSKSKYKSKALVEKQEVLYNPNSMTYTKSINWKDPDTVGNDRDFKQYNSIGSTTLNVDLMFDFTMLPKERFEYWFLYFKALTSETIEDTLGDRKRPPILSIEWGKSPYIHLKNCVITNLTWKYEMFDREGNVLRAIATLVIEEIEGKKDEDIPAIKRVKATNVEMIQKKIFKKLKI